MYKVIFIDIDGTLKNSKDEISNKTIENIKNISEKGIFVVLCSGRSRKHVDDIASSCFASKYIITSSGSEIYNREEKKVIYKNVIDKEACKKLYYLAQENNIKCIMHVDEIRVVNKLNQMDDIEVQLDTSIEEFLENYDVKQCNISDTNFEKIKSMRKEIEKIEKVQIKNQSKCLMDETIKPEEEIDYDVASIEASKGNAIKNLCKYLNIDLKYTIGIGDDFNDISMFDMVGRSVVMGNANSIIKKYADEITETNDDDGVAKFLERLLKII